MTKKNIWVKLLIVALIVAMVCVVFVACKKDDGTTNQGGNNNQGGENQGGENQGGSDTEKAVNELLGVIDDAIVSLSDIDNVGNLGADAYIDLAMEQNGKTQKVRIDLDLSLDLLNSVSGGDGYINNGFGFAVSVDDGKGTLNRVFGVWYVDEDTDADSYIYLSAGGQNLKIDGLTLASVLDKYAVNANVEVGSVLKGIGSLAENPDVSGILAMLPSLGIDIGYKEVDGNKVFSLNIKELFNPSEDNALGVTLDEMIFQNDDIAGVLSALGLAINGVGDIYNMIPDVDLEILGNYDANGKFESIGLGLAVGGKSDGITIPTKEGDGIALVEGSFPDTNLSASLGFKILSGEDAYNNVKDSLPADVDSWNEIGALNFAVEGQVVLGKTADTAKTYDVQISADINLAAVANATFVKKLYYTENGAATSKDWFYLRGVGPFEKDTDLDVIDCLLPAVNSLYVKMVNVKDASDILLINLDEKITMEGLSYTGGLMTIKLSALTDILHTFGAELPANVSGMISGIEGEKLPIGSILNSVKDVLSSFIYKSVPDGATTTAPAAEALNMAEATDSTTGGDDVMTIIMEVIDKVQKCVTINAEQGSITAAGSGADYTVGGAVLDFNIVGSLLKDGDTVNGVKVDVNKFTSNYNNNEVVTSVTGNIQIGGGELFKAVVSVDQNKAGADALDVYVGLTVNKIGYGCATRTPVVLGADYVPTASIFTNVGWVASK